jgi:hypothetical protein
LVIRDSGKIVGSGKVGSIMKENFKSYQKVGLRKNKGKRDRE